MKVLITGAEGFVGGHLISELVGRGHTVGGTYLFTPGEREDISWYECDLTKQENIRNIISRFLPDAVIHLAAISHVPDARTDYERAFQTNVTGLVHLLSAVTEHASDSKVLSISSGEIYGQIDSNDLPVSEGHPLFPRNIYGLTKECAERISVFFSRERSLQITILRPFNQFGPGQEERFVTASFARQVARVKRGLDEPVIRVGNLSVKRDFTDVRDMVAAYAQAIEADLDIGPYNLCSGRSVSIAQILDTLISIADIDVEISVDTTRVRAADISEMRGDASLFHTATGWIPRIPLNETLRDVFAQWIEDL